jgi:hypothetical protein
MEIDHDELRRDGYFFDVQTFRLDLYRLLSCFYASQGFAHHRGTNHAEELVELGGQFEEFEVTRLLVNIAATVRVVSDREKTFFRQLKLGCGRLFPDMKKPRQSGPLSLREACNKIIHATKFNFDVKQFSVRQRIGDGWSSTRQEALRPVIHLYGMKDGCDWKATLNVETFVMYNARVVQG